MNVHEYQAKDLMRRYGITVLDGQIATSAEEAVSVAKDLGGNFWVIKAQIHAGGRGKSGGVKLARSLDDVKKYALEILEKPLITQQTGSFGKIVYKLLIERGCEIEKEYYVGLVLDRKIGKIIFMASREGGVDIETIAKETPEKIIKIAMDHGAGFNPYVARKLAYSLGLKEAGAREKASQFFKGLYELYIDLDCSVAEINPLVLTKTGNIIALDAKLDFDDNALYRHADILKLKDVSEESEREIEAFENDLSYIPMEGDIGCLVNGAGLAMGTMDIIKLMGGSPANFLDVGGSATKEMVEKAFAIILSDENVKVILVNIFGGIMKCDIIAEGIVAAAQNLHITIPLIVRLEGTNVALGKKILDDSSLTLIAADDLGDAAKKAVSAAKDQK